MTGTPFWVHDPPSPSAPIHLEVILTKHGLDGTVAILKGGNQVDACSTPKLLTKNGLQS